jgi:hypothetical protein
MWNSLRRSRFSCRLGRKERDIIEIERRAGFARGAFFIWAQRKERVA